MSQKRDVKLIVGLGNPGEKHIGCRSNIGFKILEILASNNNIEIRTKKKKSLIGSGYFEGKEVILLKPQTFSELSGEAALYIASFLRIHPRDIIVIMDDYSLMLGQLVVEQRTDKDVHPAVPSLRQSLKSGEFVCVRVGIQGEGASAEECETYVKSEFTFTESMQLINIINDTETAIRSLVLGDIKEVVQKYGT